MTSPFYFTILLLIFLPSFNSHVANEDISSYSPGSSTRRKEGKMYHLVDRNVNAKEAYNYCREHGWELAIITESAEWIDVRDNLIEKYFSARTSNVQVWFGGRVLSRESKLMTWNYTWVSLPQQSFWAGDNWIKVDQQYDRCLHTRSKWGWIWFIQRCDNHRIPFLCVENFKSCNILSLHVANADIDYCHSDHLIDDGSTVAIKCWDYHRLEGIPTALCEKGRWITSSSCIPGCEEPAKRKNSTLIGNGKSKFYNTGESVTFVCNDGFITGKLKVRSHFELQCHKDGSWSEPNKDCVPSNYFNLVELNIQRSSPIKLQCFLPEHSDKDFVQWVKNDELMPNGNPEYVVDENGTLTMSGNVDEGIYYCISKNGDVQVGNTIYQLVHKESCSFVVPDEQVHFIEEKSTLLLSCNQTTSGNTNAWYKASTPLIQNANRIILPNGALLIRNVGLADEDLYVCETIGKGCKSYAYHKVKVDASVESVCGDKSKEDKSPWVVTLWNSDEIIPFCYGSLLDNQWVITSAFCVSNYRRKKNLAMSVEFGSSNGKHRRVPVESIKVHPMYRRRLNANDIGLLKLSTAVNFTDDIIPVCLLNFDVLQTHECGQSVDVNGIVSGWGSLEVHDVSEMSLGYENMSVVQKENCKNASVVSFTSDMFCCKAVSNLTGHEFAGDSGSPFLITWKGRVHLMGIYSWGQRATRSGKFDYFTYVVNHYNWIKENTESG